MKSRIMKTLRITTMTAMKSATFRFWAWLPAAALLPLASPAADVPPLLLGSAWYPEHSTESQVQADLAMMQAGGLRMARVGEFAWSSLEPEEGHYTLDWLDHVVAAAAAHGIFIVLGTPTDAPPVWLERKYPEILRVDADGRRSPLGTGRAFSYANPKYRELCREIVERLAGRFGHNPNVIGWQIGNEPTEDSYDDAAAKDYRAWLQAKYGTLASLNEHWMTWYWSQTYDSWDEIPLGMGRGNPALQLDYLRFVTDEWRSFHRNQIDAIRRYADPRQFITTNLGGLGWADRFDRHALTQDLDVAAWDDYVARQVIDPSRRGASYVSLEHYDPWRNGATHDLVRGWKQRNFWVMEMQPGFVDWAPVSNAVAPGITRDMIWQAIGHGAEGISFWQWRAGRGAVGQYHGTLAGPDTTPVPLYYEVQRAAAEIAKIGPGLAGTSPRSEVAILHDYDSRWAIDFHLQTRRYDQVDILLGYYRALRERAPSIDIVDPSCDLSRYKLVVAPSLNVISAELGARLEAYVKNGGHLLLGPRSGMKNELNALYRERQPGPLVGALGGRVEQYYALVDDVPVIGTWGTGTAAIWAEQLSTREPDTEVVLRYGAGNGWLEGQPAAIERRLGRGMIAYLGAVLDPALMQAAAKDWADAGGVGPAPIPAPDGVEVCRRVGAGREVFILINHGETQAAIRLPGPMTDALKGGELRELELPPRDVAILVRPTPDR
jgi:beta-galactosidase